MPTLLETHHLTKSIPFARGVERPILSGIDLQVSRGETVALVGRSGAGKTTLLYLLAGLDIPTSGTVSIEGTDLTRLSSAQLAALRRRRIGLVFQNNLSLSALPVWENAALPLLLEGASKKTARDAARDWLTRVGLAEYERAATSALSGGQRRRLGLARALITKPVLSLADEPTSDLDDVTADEIENLMFGFIEEAGAGAVIVTHAESISRRAGRTLRLVEGKLQGDGVTVASAPLA